LKVFGSQKTENPKQDSQGLQKKFCKSEQDCFGARGQRLLSKLRIWGPKNPPVNWSTTKIQKS